MAIGSPNLTLDERAEQEAQAKVPVSKTQEHQEHLGIKAQKGVKIVKIDEE